MRFISILLAGLLSVGLSFAGTVTYNYVGNNFTNIIDRSSPAGTTFNTSQYISGSFTFSAPLADIAFGTVTPVSFKFSSGAHTFTDADSLVLKQLKLEVTAGLITAWDIQFNDQFLYQNDPLGKQENVLYTRHTAALTIDGAQLLEIILPTSASSDSATVSNAPGVWRVATTTTAVPEPGSLALVGLALFGLLSSRRARPIR